MPSDRKPSIAVQAYQLGKAHMQLRKVEKIFSELNVATDKIESHLLDLLEFCNSRIRELKSQT